MNKISTLLTAVATVAVLSAPAVAADMRMPVKAPPPIAAVFNWTGFYIGGFVGGAVGDRDATATQPCSAVTCWNTSLAAAVTNSYDLENSFIGGGTIGYNWQPVGSQWVFGIEGEVGYIKLDRTVLDANAINAFGPTTANGFATTKIGDWYGVIAGRLGYAFDRVLVYGKGGVAFVDKHADFTDTCVAAPACGPSTISIGRSDTQVTWAAGAGVEWAFAPNWSVKGEYLYLATRESFSAAGTGSNGFAATVQFTDPGVHTGKVGVNYRF